jgi:hypothetical protein
MPPGVRLASRVELVAPWDGKWVENYGRTIVKDSSLFDSYPLVN